MPNTQPDLPQADINLTAADVKEPVTLKPILAERIWGVRSLAPWHSADALASPVGEIWLTAETCVAASGSNVGHTLAELTAAAPDAFGDPDRQGFPLLIKLLFPQEKLSVQVHPNDAEAQALGMPRGKTECWYILSAEPGAEVALGFKDPLTQAEIAAAIHDGTLEAKLRMVPVQAGDLVLVEANTVHAIGPGMVVLETQQYSDTTYRLWDYGRPRELHVAAGTAVSRSDTRAGLTSPERHDGFTRLVSSPYFLVDRFPLRHGEPKPIGNGNRLQILVALTEGCAALTGDGLAYPLPRGQAVLLPAGTGPFSLMGENARSEVVRILQP